MLQHCISIFVVLLHTYISNLWHHDFCDNLTRATQESQFSWLSKDFPTFPWLLSKFQNSLTFPWSWIALFPDQWQPWRQSPDKIFPPSNHPPSLKPWVETILHSLWRVTQTQCQCIPKTDYWIFFMGLTFCVLQLLIHYESFFTILFSTCLQWQHQCFLKVFK